LLAATHVAWQQYKRGHIVALPQRYLRSSILLTTTYVTQEMQQNITVAFPCQEWLRERATVMLNVTCYLELCLLCVFQLVRPDSNHLQPNTRMRLREDLHVYRLYTYVCM
jgi:hypothetical protein